MNGFRQPARCVVGEAGNRAAAVDRKGEPPGRVVHHIGRARRRIACQPGGGDQRLDIAGRNRAGDGDRAVIADDLPRLIGVARLQDAVIINIFGDVPEIVDIRGLGFMNAVEFNDVKKGLPSAEIANAIRLKALDKGLILLTCGVYGNVIRFLAPITIQDNVMNEALDILESSIREVCAA